MEKIAAAATGQGYLTRELKPDPEFKTRAMTSTLMWISAAMVGVIQQLMPFGIKVTSSELAALIGYPLVCGIVSATIYARAKPPFYMRAEQFFLFLAWWCISSTVYFTDGADSPFHIYVILPMLFAVYFYHSHRSAPFQIGFGSALTLLPAIYDADRAQATGFLPFMIVSLVVFWAMCFTIAVRRRSMVAAETHARRLAMTDPLTNVANLRAFQDFAQQHLDEQRPFALVMADLDGLKAVNTVAGHTGGDQMIAGVAEVLIAASGADDQVARVGGDEFAVILDGAAPEEIAAWSDRFVERQRDYNDQVRGFRPLVSASIGTASFPRDGATLDALMTAADKRMYKQKAGSTKRASELIEALETIRGRELDIVPSEERRARRIKAVGVWATASWAIAALTMLAIAQLPWFGSAISDISDGMTLIAAICAAICLSIAVISRVSPRGALHLNEWAMIAIVPPAVWLTGGSKSPILMLGLFIVAYFAALRKPRVAAVRIAIVFLLFSIVYWAKGGVDEVGQTFYTAILNCVLLNALVLQYNAHKLRQAELRSAELAMKDALTGIANRRAFELELKLAFEAAEADPDAVRPSLVLIDLDDFKGINTTFGHFGGDAALRAVAARLTEAVHDEGVVYRIGGDEFAAITYSLDPSELAERCRAAAQRSDPDSESTRLGIEMSASVGYATWRPGTNASDMILRTDMALDASKVGGKDAVTAAASNL